MIPRKEPVLSPSIHSFFIPRDPLRTKQNRNQQVRRKGKLQKKDLQRRFLCRKSNKVPSLHMRHECTHTTSAPWFSIGARRRRKTLQGLGEPIFSHNRGCIWKGGVQCGLSNRRIKNYTFELLIPGGLYVMPKCVYNKTRVAL